MSIKNVMMTAASLLVLLLSGCQTTVPEQPASPESSVPEIRIPAVKITDCKIKLEELHGDSQKSQPDVTVSYQGKTLVEGTDYTVALNESTDETGDRELIITMKGNYEGVQKVPFVISPKGTSLTSCQTKVSELTVQWEKAPNADGYELEYTCTEEPRSSKTVRASQNETELILTNLKENSSYELRIRTYQCQNGKEIPSEWSKPIKASLVPIETINGLTYVDGILVVNKSYPLPEDYGSGENPEALNAFYQMQADAAQQGIYLEIISGFRSYMTQQYTYQSFVDDRGKAEADRVSARPGHSEHQTGLAFDINTTAFYFADTAEGKWLAANCVPYGFIIRYPQGKEDKTGYQYESWHIRYVGKEKAKELTDSGLSLEEYYGIPSQYSE